MQSTATAQSPSKAYEITVYGKAQNRFVPKRIKVIFGVTLEATDASSLVEKFGAVRRRLIDKLMELGVRNVQEVSFNVFPSLYLDARDIPQVTRFRCTASFEVMLRKKARGDLVGLGRVLDGLTSAGANEIFWVQQTASEESMRRLRLQAVQGAITDARSKAQVLADGMGLKIAKVLAVDEEKDEVKRGFGDTSSPVPGSRTLVQPISPPDLCVVSSSVRVRFQAVEA